MDNIEFTRIIGFAILGAISIGSILILAFAGCSSLKK